MNIFFPFLETYPYTVGHFILLRSRQMLDSPIKTIKKIPIEHISELPPLILIKLVMSHGTSLKALFELKSGYLAKIVFLAYLVTVHHLRPQSQTEILETHSNYVWIPQNNFPLDIFRLKASLLWEAELPFVIGGIVLFCALFCCCPYNNLH